MIYTIKTFYLAISLLISVQYTFAQYEREASRLSSWYLEERFLIADRDDDALLNKRELLRFSDEFAYYLVDHHYQATDANRDGLLSFNEINQRVRSEMAYRKSMEMRELGQLVRRYPELPNADLHYLMQNPGLVKVLFGNLVWMYHNETTVETLISQQDWVERYPDVILVLQKNLRWMVSNPVDAEKIYGYRVATQQLPELLGWRADHKNFLRKYRFLDKFYELGFIE